MEYAAIVEALGYAASREAPVRLLLADGRTLVGVPTSVDTHVTAFEVFLRPAGDDETEIAVSLGAVRQVELA